MTDKPKKLDAENFVRIWQLSATPEDFVHRSGGMDFEKAGVRATQMRQKGVPLKKFPRKGRGGLDYDKLKALAEEFDPLRQQAATTRKARGAQ